MGLVKILWLALLLPGLAMAASAASPLTPSQMLSSAGSGIGPLVPPGAQGYWFYLNPPAPVPQPQPPIPVKPPSPSSKPKPCQHMDSWTAQCGFVTPNSFAMQSKERDALLQNMVMSPGDPASVLAVQQYTRWILHQSIYAARVWQHNRLQNPKQLDPSATSPISAFGLRLAMDVKATNRKTVWAAIRQFGGILIVFTKDDCDYCHAQTGPLQALAQDTGLTIWNASLKGPCLSAYVKYCMTPAKSTMPARILHVSLVPTVMLYLPQNVWIRVSAGLTDTQTIEARIYNLFISWKAAASGIAKQTGHTGLALDPNVTPTDTQQLKALLMKPVRAESKSGTRLMKPIATESRREQP